MNQKSRIEITPDHINVCATQRQVDLLISKAARRSEYMALLGEGFEYHGYDEHVVIAKAFCLSDVADLFQAAVRTMENINNNRLPKFP
jgi:hypothetical protein